MKFSKIKVFGFGSRCPPEVLEVLSSYKKSQPLCRITAIRSQTLELKLLNPPYRTFLDSFSGTSSTAPVQNITVYCLPTTSLSEYLTFSAEINSIRSKLFQSDELVILFDPSNSTFSCDILASPSLHEVRSAALSCLSKLDATMAPKLDQLGQSTVLVIGSGGREHALSVSLALSPLVSAVKCCPGNGGTENESDDKISNLPSIKSNSEILDYLSKNKVDLVVVGPEQPLVDGLVDSMYSLFPKVRVFGPTKAAAMLEASKAFSKDFMQKHGIPTAAYRTFTSVSAAKEYASTLTERVVVKASGLAAGKGVLLPNTPEETLAAIDEIMTQQKFGDAGDECVIESFLEGPEASCLAICDGNTAKLLPAAQDHKRALDGDEGANTGGMGAYAPSPSVTPSLFKEIEEMCCVVVREMKKAGTPYVGVLYAGVLLTKDGPSILEFNCRFGDPEAQVILPLLESDLFEVLYEASGGTLENVDVRCVEGRSAATVVCAALGYPEKYPKGMEIVGLEDVEDEEDVKVYHAGTKLEDGVVRCNGGRVLAVTGTGATLKEALRNSYKCVKQIDFIKDGEADKSVMHYRTDIAHRAVNKKLRIGVMGSTRGTSLLEVMEACSSAAVEAEIVCVVSNRSKSLILEKGNGIPNCKSTFVSAKGKSRMEYDAECTSVLLEEGVDFVILVGYMRILSAEFCEYWAGRCVNVHPSLLPKYKGMMDLDVHKAVLKASDTETGCSVHYVTSEVDDGPVSVQKRVSVSPDDTPETLKSKVQATEGPALIEAIRHYILPKAITYRDAGVDIAEGNNFVDGIKQFCKNTKRPGCDADLGGFGGLFDLKAAGYDTNETVLIGATDGVGTKLKIAHECDVHSTVGVDLVAMCVNDLIVAGGEPLFFLDYFACGKLSSRQAAEVVKGIAEGCKLSNCGLIGGETAEMPGMYAPGEYDLAGFSVGACSRQGILPKNIQVGDVLLGLESSGIHSNGFSLVRKLVQGAGLDYSQVAPWDVTKTVGESLLTPTKIYVKSCMPLIRAKLLNGMAHITGGGLIENLPRSLPKKMSADIHFHPTLPKVFRWLQEQSHLEDEELLRTFNCGIGMVLIVSKENAEAAKQMLLDSGEHVVHEMGVLVNESSESKVIMKASLS